MATEYVLGNGDFFLVEPPVDSADVRTNAGATLIVALVVIYLKGSRSLLCLKWLGCECACMCACVFVRPFVGASVCVCVCVGPIITIITAGSVQLPSSLFFNKIKIHTHTSTEQWKHTHTSMCVFPFA